jgi:hypothetical protein
MDTRRGERTQIGKGRKPGLPDDFGTLANRCAAGRERSTLF